MKNILGNSIRELRKSKKNDASRACEKKRDTNKTPSQITKTEIDKTIR